MSGNVLGDAPRTMFAKIWDSHVIADLGNDTALLHIDRHILHDLGGAEGVTTVKQRGLPVHNPELTFATVDDKIETTVVGQPQRKPAHETPTERLINVVASLLLLATVIGLWVYFR